MDATVKISAGFFSADSRVLFNPGSDGAPALAEDQVLQGAMDEGITGKFAGLGDRPHSVMIGRQPISKQRTADDLHTTLVQYEAASAQESRLS